MCKSDSVQRLWCLRSCESPDHGQGGLVVARADWPPGSRFKLHQWGATQGSTSGMLNIGHICIRVSCRLPASSCPRLLPGIRRDLASDEPGDRGLRSAEYKASHTSLVTEGCAPRSTKHHTVCYACVYCPYIFESRQVTCMGVMTSHAPVKVGCVSHGNEGGAAGHGT